MKQLYTAITRCCKEFLLAESKNTVALATLRKWATHRRCGDEHSGHKEWLLKVQKIETVEQTVMTQDKWIQRGLLFATRAEEEGALDEQEKWLKKCLVNFGFGGDEKMELRAQTHLKSLRMRKKLSQRAVGVGLASVETDEQKMSALIRTLVECGLGIEARVSVEACYE